MAFTVVYDTSVLFPQSVRDLLVRLAATDLFRARWTEDILDELVNSVVERYPDIARERMVRTRELMCEAVRDCLVTGYEPFIDAFELPDSDDRHVLAAAVRCGAQVIVTENIRDFPTVVLEPLGIEAQTADTFVLHVVDLAPGQVAATVRQQASALTRPSMSVSQLLERLEVAGLRQTVAELRLRAFGIDSEP